MITVRIVGTLKEPFQAHVLRRAIANLIKEEFRCVYICENLKPLDDIPTPPEGTQIVVITIDGEKTK